MSNYYRTCEECGAHLDPGEHCECERRRSMRKNNMPEPATVADAELLKQMGYSTVIEDGRVATVVKDKSGACSICGMPVDKGRHICFDCYIDEHTNLREEFCI